MRQIALAASFALLLGLSPGVAAAQSCYDLWYERNLIFAQNGYCFTTSLGRRTFAGYDCWTSNPRLTAGEQRRVAQIQALERRYGCRVNR
jgi:hypothetical protein